MAPAHVRRAAAAAAAIAARRCGSTAAAGRCASPVHHAAAAPTRLARAAAPNPLAHAAATPTPRALHHRVSTPLSFTPRRRFTGNALVPIIPEEPPASIPSFIRREVNKIESADIALHRELGQVVSQLTRDVTKQHSAARESRVKNALHVGTVTWRVCTTVITVTVAAAAGMLQLAKPGWEAAAEEAACAIVTEKVGKMTKELQEGFVKGVAQRRALAAANMFLKVEKEKAVAEREEEIAARNARLDKWEADLVKKETGSK